MDFSIIISISSVEEELRRIDPTVSLAYWDQTMDANMTLPSQSVLWTACFFGNGNGTITEGPFRGWYGGRLGPIQRDYARDACDNGRLITKNDLLNVLSKCSLKVCHFACLFCFCVFLQESMYIYFVQSLTEYNH